MIYVWRQAPIDILFTKKKTNHLFQKKHDSISRLEILENNLMSLINEQI
jgi:hypothetical protein